MDGKEQEDGTWIRVDPVSLRREAEAKEAKLKRKQEQRDVRAAQRREKRQVKSEAKQARKANVKRAAKWTDERRAADRLKKIANRPAKQDKRRRRLLQRAERLEHQARKLMVEAQKARARYQYLEELRLKEEATKNTILVEQKETDDYIPLGADDGIVELAKTDGKALANGHVSSDESSSDSSDDEAEEAIPKSGAPAYQVSDDDDVDMFQDNADNTKLELDEDTDSEPLPEEIERPKKSKKSKKEKKDKKKKAKTASENGDVDEDIEEDTTLHVVIDTTEPSEKPAKLEKKKKKRAKSDVYDENPGTIDDLNGDSLIDAEPVEKSAKKDKKRKRGTEGTEVGAADDDIPAKKSKRDKKSKKEKKPKEKYDEPTTAQESNTDAGEQWNVGELEGGSDRQDRFLRLLGGKKATKAAKTGALLNGSASGVASRGRLDMAHVAKDLQKQFDVGTKMRFEAHAHRKGLGA